MQFGILYLFFTLLDDQAFAGIVYLWMALALSYPQNLNSSIKEQGKASTIILL